MRARMRALGAKLSSDRMIAQCRRAEVFRCAGNERAALLACDGELFYWHATAGTRGHG